MKFSEYNSRGTNEIYTIISNSEQKKIISIIIEEKYQLIHGNFLVILQVLINASIFTYDYIYSMKYINILNLFIQLKFVLIYWINFLLVLKNLQSEN